MEDASFLRAVFFPSLPLDCKYILVKKLPVPVPFFLYIWYHSHYLTLCFPQRYLIAGFFLCFSPKQKPLCKKDAEEAKPAEMKKEEEKPNDVEAGGAAGDEGGVKAQVY